MQIQNVQVPPSTSYAVQGKDADSKFILDKRERIAMTALI